MWKTLGLDPHVVNVSSRYGAVQWNGQRIAGLNNIELITDRPLDVNLQEITQVKRDWPDRALIVSLMVPCNERDWKWILPLVEDTGCDGVELNFGCPHGMSERGMGAAVGQVPEYVEMVTRWVKEGTKLPCIVKLTPNISDIRTSSRAAYKGGADAVSLINTINSIVAVDLDLMAPMPTVDGKGTHGGYCGPAVKPIALNMVAEIARDVETPDLPISGIGGISSWRDAAEFMVLGAGNVQVCTAAMHYGFRIVSEHRLRPCGRPVELDGRKRLRHARRYPWTCRAECDGLEVFESEVRHQGAHRPGQVHRVRPVPYRLRRYGASGDHARERWQAPFRSHRFGMRRVQFMHACVPGRAMHHDGTRGCRRICELDDASEQSRTHGRRR